MTGASDRTQLERFKEAARELETDDDESRFDEKLKRLARQKMEKAAKSAAVMTDEVQRLTDRIAKLEIELESVWHILDALKDALGAEDFMAAHDAISHPIPVCPD